MSSPTVRMELSSQQPVVQMQATQAAPALGMNVEAGGVLGVAADTAKRLETPRRLSLGGAAHGSALFDGSADTEIYAALETLTNEELEALLS